MEATIHSIRHRTKDLKESSSLIGQEVTIKGWVRTIRAQKTFAFMEVNDGSQLSNLQVILNANMTNYEALIEKIATGASVSVTGILKKSPGKEQSVEIEATICKVIGEAPSDYVLQKKRHSFEYLRTIAHLRPRTNTFGAVTRIRNSLAYSTHKFFQEKNFLYIHTPIITASDCEGAGELFSVSTLDIEKPPKNDDGIDYAKDFFGKKAFLTVSGQLNVEAFAQSMSDVYTFGPTFRAENSNTSRHLAEFWMIEPEMAFADLQDDMKLATEYVQYTLSYALENNAEDLEFFDKFVKNGLVNELQKVASAKFAQLSYTDAIELLTKANKAFQFPVKWGLDLQSEHERFLAEEHFKSPVIIYNYPKSIKPFYMKSNDDNKTVAAMDLLVPGIGELIGGSQREDNTAILEENLRNHNLNPEIYDWYIDLRKYGSTPHAGFGLGFERLVQYVTGMENIRDVIPYPRYPGHALF